MIRLFAFILILSILNIGIFAQGIEKYYRFPESGMYTKVTFETERKLCIFPLKNQNADSNLDYLSKGYGGVLFSGLKGLFQIFDPDVIPKSIQHGFGDPIEKERLKKGEWDGNILERVKNIKETSPEKDPRFLTLKTEFISEETPPEDSNLFLSGKKAGCFYHLAGTYEKKSESQMELKLVLRSSKDASRKEFRAKTSIRRSYQELEGLIGEIKKELVGKNTVSFSFKSGDIDGVLVFLDGQFLGKTPLQRSDILPGNRKVKYYMDGFQSEEKRVSIQDGGSFEMILARTPKDGLISVTSNPEGANVYLGSEFLGKTPIINVRVKTGYNRLRLSMEGHVDLLKGVEIKKDEETKLDLVLKQGDTITYYKNKQNVFLDHSYNDFSIYSLYGTLLFYVGYYYFNLKANDLYDRARSRVNLTGLYYASLSAPQDQFIGLYLYEERIVRETNRDAGRYQKLAGNFGRHEGLTGGVMIYGMAAMLILAVTFYWLGLDEETLDVGAVPKRLNNPYAIPGQFVEIDSFAKFNLKF
ncbi:PEGA domain protein [Leptospira kirschneri serovar Bim str. 1051]|uniref:PEGA domain-containing protein n=1 Tax=Leptospira kirschneri TaxID=29507 RepID=UPI0002BE1960|nr:PEGA domain-containing protein [Leptospira kirschneri]EMK13727.1 PEGA domain protein [Leptospira kirschneri serovar Bim str. PUO 1247]EMN05663.1 PEGA domain protein [Leptospira kirschneri serovar Bim str. 1051]